MSQANRVYGKHLAVLNVASQDILAYVQDCTIDFNVTTIDGTVLTDTVQTNLPNREDYTVRFRLSYDTDGESAINTLIGAVGTSVNFSVGSAASGHNYSGNGLLSSGTHSIPDGGQTVEFTIVADGSTLTK